VVDNRTSIDEHTGNGVFITIGPSLNYSEWMCNWNYYAWTRDRTFQNRSNLPNSFTATLHWLGVF